MNYLLIFLSLLVISGCSTLSQTLESPVVVEKKKYALGVGATYTHNINNYAGDERQQEETVPVGFIGGRYGLVRNVEVSAAGGTLGLTGGTSVDLRLRYMWLGGWRSRGHRRKKIEEDDDADFDERDLVDRPAYVPNGWLSTVSLGGYWSGYNDLQDYSVGQFDSGIYLSNSVGWKKGSHVYYFGAKILQLQTDYHYKADRLSFRYDVESKYSQLTYGAFLGYTYARKSRRRHIYAIDTMLTIMQLPKSPEDRSNGLYPALTMSFWYTD